MNDNRRLCKLYKEVKNLLLALKDDKLLLFMEKMGNMFRNYQFQLNLLEIKDSNLNVLSVMEAEYMFRLFTQISLIHPDIPFLDPHTQQIISQATIDDSASLSLKSIQLSAMDYLLSVQDKNFLRNIVDIFERPERVETFSKYKTSILTYLRNNPQELLLRISVNNLRTLLPIVSNLLDDEIKCKVEEKREVLLLSIVNNFDKIWTPPDRLNDINISELNMTIEILKKMIVLDEKICSNEALLRFFSTILSLETISLDLKNTCVYLLPSFYKGSSFNESSITSLVSKVKSLVLNQLIVLNSNFLYNDVLKSPEYNIIKTIIECLRIDCGVSLHLRWIRSIIAPIICMEVHQCWDDVLRENLKILCNNLDSRRQVLGLTELEDELKMQTHFPHLLKYLHKFYLVFIFYSSEESLSTFFLPRIPSLKDNLQLSDDLSEVQSQQILVNLEILCGIYRGLGSLDKNLKSGLRDSKIISELSKLCRAIVDCSLNTPLSIYLLRSSAFSCLCAIVIATQSVEKFFIHLLLKPNRPLFQQFIHNGCFPKFPNELISEKMRTVYFRISSSSNINEERNFSRGKDLKQEAKRIHVSSQFLSDSSLALDTNKLEHIFSQNNNVAQFHYNKVDEIKIDLEDDEVNRHPCMETMIFLLLHMLDLGFISTNNNVSLTLDVPAWMKVLRDTYFDESISMDIKYFITKLILNCKNIFNHYAPFWLNGLLTFIISSQSSSNKFLVSVVNIISQWLSLPHSVESLTRPTLNDFVKFLINLCNSENPAMNAITLELYLDVIKSLSGKVDIPYKSIFDNIDCAHSNIINTKLQLLAYTLRHKFPFKVDGTVEDKMSFLKPILQNLKHKSKNIYAPTFEVCGMLMSEADNDFYRELNVEITSALEFVLSRNLCDYVTCMALVTKGSIKFAKTQDVIIMSMLKRMSEKDLSKSIEILGTSTNTKEGLLLLCEDLQGLKLFDSLIFRPGYLIISLLQIVLKTVTNIPQWSVEEHNYTLIRDIFKGCQPCCKHEDRQVRCIFYQLVIELASKDEDFTAEPSILSSILVGIVDPDQTVSQSVRNFCSSPPRLPTQSLSRAAKILVILFPASQSMISEQYYFDRHKFLALATNLLLEMTSHSPDFIKPYFDKCLINNVTYETLTAARISSQTTRSILPNFIENVSTIISPISSHEIMFKKPTTKNIPLTSQNFDWIKVAASLKLPEISALEENNAEYSAEWPSSQIPGVDINIALRSQSSFLSHKKYYDEDNQNKNIRTQEKTIEHRFATVLKKSSMTEETDSDFYRRRTIENQRRQVKDMNTKRNIQESAMFIYRNYRTGKVPDIQIQNSAIITSLQMLAQYKEEFAGELFCHLYDKLIAEGSLILNSDDFRDGCDRIRTCLDNILWTCKSYDKILVSSCLSIAINHFSILQIQPSHIFRAAILTNTELLATMLMEMYVQNEYPNDKLISTWSEPSRKKLRKSENELIDSIAPFLLKLYKCLDLNEEIIGFIESYLTTKTDGILYKFRLALEFDCKDNHHQSFKLYNEILTKSNLTSECDSDTFRSEVIAVSEEGLINSLRKLSRWSDLTNFLELHSSYDLNKISLTSKAIVNSKLRLVLQKEENEIDNMKYLNTLLNDGCSSILERDLLLSKEMAVFNILKDDMAKAEHYCKLSCKQMLGNVNDSDFVKDVRIKQLQNMQILYEMSEFINATDICDYQLLMKKWVEKLPDRYKDSIEFWEELMFHRQTYLKVIKGKYSQENIESVDKCILDLQLKYIDASICQNRTLTTLNALQQCRSSSLKYGEECKMSWCFMYGRVWLRSVSPHGTMTLAENIADVIKGISNSILQLRKLSVNISFGIEYNDIVGDCFWTLANIARTHWPQLSSALINDIRLEEIFSDTKICDQKEIINYLSKISFLHLEKILLEFKTLGSMTGIKEMSNSLMVLSDFCDSQIAVIDDNPTIDISSSIYHCFIESTLLSMNQEHFSAKNKFPRVLQVAEQIWDEKCQSLVINTCSTIPSWMFLSWLDQMMTYLFSQKSTIINETLWRITTDYPHALFFPFYLRFKDNDFNSLMIDKIEKELHNLRITHQFSAALNRMIQPEDHLLKWIAEVNKQYKSDLIESDLNRILEKYQNLFEEIFENTQESLDFTIVEKGVLHKEFINEFRQEFVNNFQEDGGHIPSLTEEQFQLILKKIKEKLHQWKSTSTDYKLLNDYSPWFSKYCLQDHFQQINEAEQDWLEVPGQYNNVTSRPFPQKHVKILAFLPEVEVLNSKQKPKKIKIIGDNEQCYKFLVKAGEDLRQDFRIEHLFSVMNVMLSQDTQAKFNRRMQQLIVTFNVIPVSKMIGMLEWVENTVVLQDFLMKTTTIEEKKLISSIKCKNYSIFTDFPSYTTSWLSSDFEESNRLFAESQRSIVNLDLLRRSFMVIARNNESFFRLRMKFIQQYAIMVAAHYILGIGDRHLNNFLLDESSGNIVGIDFGFSFGVSSIVLPVPELIPFRLTSSFVSFMRPAGVNGLFSQAIESVLSIFGRHQTTIMSILQVFLSDQIIDWQRLSMAIQQPLDSFTHRRITLSHRKLLRKSPSLILLEELSMKHKNCPWFERFTKHCCDNLTFDDSTKELVALASDLSVLARTYRGWDALM